jgi:hypothetical protein
MTRVSVARPRELDSNNEARVNARATDTASPNVPSHPAVRQYERLSLLRKAI